MKLVTCLGVGDRGRLRWGLLLVAVLVLLSASVGRAQQSARPRRSDRSRGRSTPQVFVQLPQPQAVGSMTVPQALQRLQNLAPMLPVPLNGTVLSQLAWAAVTTVDIAAGAHQWISGQADESTRGLELFFVTAEGLFRYVRNGHRLEQVALGDSRALLTTPADGLGAAISYGAGVLVTDSRRTTGGRRGNEIQQQTGIVAGQITAALRLQAADLGLISIPLEPLDDIGVRRALGLPRTVQPLVFLLVGYPPSGAQVSTGPANRAVPPSAGPSGMPVVLLAPAEGFQDQELQFTQQALTAAGQRVVIASTQIGPIHGVLGQTAYATVLLEQIQPSQIAGLVLIGADGVPLSEETPQVKALVSAVLGQGKPVGALSTAVTLLAQAGLLQQVRVTGHPSDRKVIIEAGAVFTGNLVETDGLVVTASGAAGAASLAQTVALIVRTHAASGTVPVGDR